MQVIGHNKPGFEEILSNDALQFIELLHHEFNGKRKEILQTRIVRQAEIDEGKLPGFLPETADVRSREWQVAPIPADIQDRRVEITGPVDRKMIINALNSGAKVFMADFEDANSPTWENVVEGQINLRDAIRKQIDFTVENGKEYKLNDDVAVLMVRPRGWHLHEKHVKIGDEFLSASLFDFGLYFFHNAMKLLEIGSGPYFYLPKLEGHKEARLWNEVFEFSQEKLDIPNGSIKATVLIETILAAFEMEEIIYELRDHLAGLNAGRWDYIFSIIKKFCNFPEYVLPDRSQITMTVPFMHAYADSLVHICHKHGAHAIGGMSAFIPSRRDEEVNKVALEKVTADKEREAGQGYDGTWVAHPDLVAVAVEPFNKAFGNRVNQKDNLRADAQYKDADYLTFSIQGGKITEAGLRLNINVGILYIESWLRGTGAAAIYNLMEDAATAEISRAQIWQWIHNSEIVLNDGREATLDLYRKFLDEELKKIEQMFGSKLYGQGRFQEAVEILNKLVEKPVFEPFLTLQAYNYL